VATRLAFDRDKPFHDVAENGHVREEVELLEHHAHPLAQPVQPALAIDHAIATGFADRLAFEDDTSGIGPLKKVDAAQQRALARPRCADDRDPVTTRDCEIDTGEHLGISEALADPLKGENGEAHQSRGVHQLDGALHEGREHAFHRLGKDNAPEALRMGHPDGAACLALALIDRDDAGTEDLREERAGLDAEGQQRSEEWRHLHIQDDRQAK
jgi:hypothetical protein